MLIFGLQLHVSFGSREDLGAFEEKKEYHRQSIILQKLLRTVKEVCVIMMVMMDTFLD